MNKGSCSKNPKSKILTLSLLIILPFFLTACSLSDLPVIGGLFGGSEENGDGGNTDNNVDIGSASITVWGLWEKKEVMDVLIDRYKEQYPNVNVNYDDRSVLKPLVEYKTRAFTRATDETGPDVMRVHISWLPALVNSLEPMPSGIMDLSTFQSSFYSVAVDNLVYDGKIYGMPTYHDGLVLVYNKDHFSEIGQTEAPTAWEEFRRLALDLTIRGEGDEIVRAGAAIGAADNVDFSSDILGMLFSQAGVEFPAEVDGRPAQDALSFYTNFVLEDEVWSEGLPEATVAFSQGKASMIFVPTWNLLDILAARPDMNVGIAPVPQARPDNPASWASFWVDVVPQASQNPKAAWSYIAFMAKEEQQLYAYSQASQYRVFGSPYSLISLQAELSENPYLAPVLESASYASTNIMASRAGNRRQVDAVNESINSILGGRITASEALTTAKLELSR
ncbi:extracellular solute-binding protein [Patescibacteria group bacterium]